MKAIRNYQCYLICLFYNNNAMQSWGNIMMYFGRIYKKLIHSGNKQPVKGGDIFSVLRLVKNGGRVAKEK